MLPVTRNQFGLLCGIAKNMGPYIARYVILKEVDEMVIDKKKKIDINNQKNRDFILSRVSVNSVFMSLLDSIYLNRKCPSEDELRSILFPEEPIIEKATRVNKVFSDEKQQPTAKPIIRKEIAPISNNERSRNIDDVVLVGLKDYKDYYEAKSKQERWEILKIDKAKMLGNTIPTDIAIDSLTVFGSTMQNTFIEMTKRWIIDISHEANLDAVLSGKMRGRMVEIVNSSFKKSIEIAKKALKDGIEGSKNPGLTTSIKDEDETDED